MFLCQNQYSQGMATPPRFHIELIDEYGTGGNFPYLEIITFTNSEYFAASYGLRSAGFSLDKKRRGRTGVTTRGQWTHWYYDGGVDNLVSRRASLGSYLRVVLILIAAPTSSVTLATLTSARKRIEKARWAGSRIATLVFGCAGLTPHVNANNRALGEPVVVKKAVSAEWGSIENWSIPGGVPDQTRFLEWVRLTTSPPGPGRPPTNAEFMGRKRCLEDLDEVTAVVTSKVVKADLSQTLAPGDPVIPTISAPPSKPGDYVVKSLKTLLCDVAEIVEMESHGIALTSQSYGFAQIGNDDILVVRVPTDRCKGALTRSDAPTGNLPQDPTCLELASARYQKLVDLLDEGFELPVVFGGHPERIRWPRPKLHGAQGDASPCEDDGKLRHCKLCRESRIHGDCDECDTEVGDCCGIHKEHCIPGDCSPGHNCDFSCGEIHDCGDWQQAFYLLKASECVARWVSCPEWSHFNFTLPVLFTRKMESNKALANAKDLIVSQRVYLEIDHEDNEVTTSNFMTGQSAWEYFENWSEATSKAVIEVAEIRKARPTGQEILEDYELPGIPDRTASWVRKRSYSQSVNNFDALWTYAPKDILHSLKSS